MRRLLHLIALIAIATPAYAQNFDTVQVRSTMLSRGVYMLTGSGGNIGVAVGEDAVFVIDDQFAPLTPKILAAIAAITPKPVKFILNTHWHGDHTGGNDNMSKTGALIVAHENVRKRMSTDQFIEAFNQKTPASPASALPVVTFTDGVTFHINGDSVIVTHVNPAHTDGDAFIYFSKANVLHTGDLFNTAGMPFVDLSSGGSINGIIMAAEKMLSIVNAQTKIIPGHGPLADRSKLQAYHDMLVATREVMRDKIASRRSIEQVLADSITRSYMSGFPANHERYVRILFQELSRK